MPEETSSIPNQPEVVVVDDDPEIRTSIEQLLGSVGLVVKTFPSANALVEGYDLRHAGCAILDVRMPGTGGLQLHQLIAKRAGSPPTIILTAHADVSMAVEAMKNGVFDFIEKPFAPQKLIQRVQDAIVNHVKTQSALKESREVGEKLDSLSPREREIMALLVDGKTTKEIGFELGISDTTVDFHRHNLFHKMGVDNSVCLTRLYDQHQDLVKS